VSLSFNIKIVPPEGEELSSSVTGA